MSKKFVGQEYAVATRGKGLKQDPWWWRLLSRTAIAGSVVVMLISIAMITFCATFLMSPIIGTSMMTRLNATGKDTDTALTCRVKSPDRGDIVIFKLYAKDTSDISSTGDYIAQRYPNKDSNGQFMYIIKRLIAKPGDQISIERTPNYNNHSDEGADYNYDYYIYLNGEKLNEYYLDPLVAHPSSRNFVQLWRVLNGSNEARLEDWQTAKWADCIHNGVLTVPEDYYFIMGDNRDGFEDGNSSWDSCYFGPISKKNFVGVCVDVLHEDTSMPHYLWDKIVYYVFFGWLWQN